MAAYGVTYSGPRAPRGYGVTGRRTLASLYSGATPQRPSLASSFNPISDTLSSLQAANAGRLSGALAPQAAPQTFGGVDPNRAGTVAPPASTLGTLAPPDSITGNAAQGGQYATPGSQPKPPAPPAAPSGTDLFADPILTQIKALGQRNVGDAASQGLAGSKNDLINYGSVNVPQSLRDLFATQTPANDSILGDLPGNPVLGALNDAGTATAASGNPFSVLAGLGNAHDSNVHGIDQATNLANLYYSSTHANQLGQENQNYLGSQNTAANNLATLLSGENTGFLSALGGAHDQYLSELPNAYQRALAAGGSGFAASPMDSNAPPAGDGTTPPPGPFNTSAPATPAALPPPDSVVGNAANGGQFSTPPPAFLNTFAPPDSVVGNAAYGGQYATPAAAAPPSAPLLAYLLANRAAPPLGNFRARLG